VNYVNYVYLFPEHSKKKEISVHPSTEEKESTEQEVQKSEIQHKKEESSEEMKKDNKATLCAPKKKKIIILKKPKPETEVKPEETKSEVKIDVQKKNDRILSFMIKNTTIPEIYELYLKSSENENRKEKISYASVPNIETSAFLKKIFKENQDNPKKEIYVRCEFHDTFKKWVPMEKSDSIDTVDTLHWFQSVHIAHKTFVNK
jgi:hypothetical protein